MYCLPVLKHETDRQALWAAVRSGSPKFFLGSDSAPHARTAKESSCGCAGIFSAHAALEFYAIAFEAAGCLDKLPAFATEHGPAFYRLPLNDLATHGAVELRREEWTVPAEFPLGHDAVVVPLGAGTALPWKAVRVVAE